MITRANCGTCRYWSEMLARAGGGTDNPRGDVEAICHAAGGPFSNRYVTADKSCGYFRSGGAVDDPRAT